MEKCYHILLIVFTFGFLGCASLSAEKPSKDVVVEKQLKSELQSRSDTIIDQDIIEKYTADEILKMIVGTYVADECKFELKFYKQNKKVHYSIQTEKRKIKGVAKISMDENGYIAVIFPIQWDDYQGDMTQETYEPNREEKPQEVYMTFYTESKTLDFQNYGNAMNNYIIFDECDVKYVTLKRDKGER